MRHQYLLQYDTIKAYSVEGFIACLSSIRGLPLKELKMSDLIFVEGEPIYPNMGVYIFKEGEDFVYVGKCSSQSFIQRIPSHFDFRDGAWFHSLLKTIKEKALKEKYSKYQKMDKEAKLAIDNYSLILINFDLQSKDQIEHIEDLLRCTLNVLNKFKGKRYKNMDLPIDKYHKKHSRIVI